MFGQLSFAARYDLRLAERITVYPKLGVGFFFSGFPVTYVGPGLGGAYRVTQKFGAFAEAGNLLAHRESQLRANWYFLGRYIRAGIELRP